MATTTAPDICLKSVNKLAPFASGMITIRVGSKPSKDFFVHKDVLCNRSPFFKGAVSGEWKEGKASLVHLPEDDQETFSLYCSWLYDQWPLAPSQGKIENHGTDYKDKENHRIWDQEVFKFWKAYVFGDKILDRDFCDFVIDCMLNHARETKYWVFGYYHDIFTMSQVDAPPRNLLVDCMVHIAGPDWFGASQPDFEKDAWKVIAKAMIENKSKKTKAVESPLYIDHCNYHWHSVNNKPCYKITKQWRRTGLAV